MATFCPFVCEFVYASRCVCVCVHACVCVYVCARVCVCVCVASDYVWSRGGGKEGGKKTEKKKKKTNRRTKAWPDVNNTSWNTWLSNIPNSLSPWSDLINLQTSSYRKILYYCDLFLFFWLDSVTTTNGEECPSGHLYTRSKHELNVTLPDPHPTPPPSQFSQIKVTCGLQENLSFLVVWWTAFRLHDWLGAKYINTIDWALNIYKDDWLGVKCINTTDWALDI